MDSSNRSDSVFSADRITRAVVISQMLFMAGHSLTTGGFLNYFVYTLHPSAFLLAAVQIAPEASEALSIVTGNLLRIVHSRKWLWIVSLICGRLAALLIPCSLLLENQPQTAFAIILSAVVVWHLFQGIAYCSYISWLSQLVPEKNWGGFFAKRNIASLSIAIVVPIGAGLARRYWINGLAEDWQVWSYAIIFGTGALLVLASIVPLLPIPDCPVHTTGSHSRFKWSIQLTADFRWLLASRWWLSFFQGLTQAVIFSFSVSILKISLEEYYVLLGLMLLLQMGTSWIAGKLCDRAYDRTLLIWSLVGVSFAMLFWWAATPESKWMAAGAYAIWGGFGFVNVALQNLTLKLAPADHNALHISLSRQGSGLIAGFAGLLGGALLTQLLEHSDWPEMVAYQTLFLISWIGRLTAACWLLPIAQPPRVESVVR